MNFKSNKKIIFTIDVEHDIQKSYSTNSAQITIPKIVSILKKYNILGEFFLSVDILLDNKNIGKIIKENGHSIGNHNLIHGHLKSESIKNQYEQIRASTNIFKDIIGENPKAFRAPNFSINQDTINILEELNYSFDSSVFPKWKKRNNFFIKTDIFPNALEYAYHPSSDDFLKKGSMKLIEIPVSKNPRRNSPIGGGGLCRFGLDYMYDLVDNYNNDIVILLFHPLEFLSNHIPNNDGIDMFKKFEDLINYLSNKYTFILFKDIEIN